jgi:hypothetical protein
VGRFVTGTTGQRGNRLPLALPRRCPLAYTVDSEHRIFFRPVTAGGPHVFLVHSVSGVDVHCLGRHRMDTVLTRRPLSSAASPNPLPYLSPPILFLSLLQTLAATRPSASGRSCCGRHTGGWRGRRARRRRRRPGAAAPGSGLARGSDDGTRRPRGRSEQRRRRRRRPPATAGARRRRRRLGDDGSQRRRGARRRPEGSRRRERRLAQCAAANVPASATPPFASSAAIPAWREAHTPPFMHLRRGRCGQGRFGWASRHEQGRADTALAAAAPSWHASLF